MSTFTLLLVTGLGLGGLYFLVAGGLSLVFGLMDVLNFAHGAVLTLSGYVAYFALSHDPDTPQSTGAFLLALLIGAAVGGGFSALIEVFLIRPLYSRGHMAQLLVTVGLSFAVIAVIESTWSPDTHPYRPPAWMTHSITIGEIRFPADRLIVVGIAGLVLAGLLLLLRRTRAGLIIRAGVENREMVSVLGINVRSVFTLVFALGGALAGLGGVLAVSFLRQVSPGIGHTFLIFAVIVIIIGGLGSITGSAVAAVVVAMIQQFANHLSTGLGDIAVVVLLAGVLLARPQGLMGVPRT
ncbi:branched-chain amino acid ABC transporter permease [Streptomyces sp. NPDC055078]